MPAIRLPTAVPILALAAALAMSGAALAQSWDASDPLTVHRPERPVPVYVPPSVDALINGNGELHFSGQWRHSGDSRNNGELVQMLLAPNQVAAHNRAHYRGRLCDQDPRYC